MFQEHLQLWLVSPFHRVFFSRSGGIFFVLTPDKGGDCFLPSDRYLDFVQTTCVCKSLLNFDLLTGLGNLN